MIKSTTMRKPRPSTPCSLAGHLSSEPLNKASANPKLKHPESPHPTEPQGTKKAPPPPKKKKKKNPKPQALYSPHRRGPNHLHQIPSTNSPALRTLRVKGPLTPYSPVLLALSPPQSLLDAYPNPFVRGFSVTPQSQALNSKP